LDRILDELSDGRLFEESRATAGLVEQAIHRDEGFA
jgi:hypothetical protein